MSELNDARTAFREAHAALKATYDGRTMGAIVAGYAVHLARPGGERALVARAIDEDLWPETIQTSSVVRMLCALDRTFRFHRRRLDSPGNGGSA